MTTASPAHVSRKPGRLEDYLPADDIMAVPPLTDGDWDTLRRQAGRSLAWQFCTLRNLAAYRGRFSHDAMGFAWGGIYRSLFVSSIVTTSYRNEGHFRSGERIQGTRDFFFGSFVFPRSAAAFHEIIRLVNLRHHVAGVVRPAGADGVAVLDGYEAEYAYVATAFIESIRRGLAICGLPPESARGRALAWQVATILYQLAGFTGLRRMPRDLPAHDRFRDAFDRRLLERPPSTRVRQMAREIARRIVPFTAVMAGETVAGHVRRHLDPQTRELLFPGDSIPAELEQRRIAWQRERSDPGTLAAISRRSASRQAIWERADVADLGRAYREAIFINNEDHLDDRLIGAVLLHAVESGRESARPFARRTIELAAGEPLIRQGDPVHEMYLVLSATAPLVVLQTVDSGTMPQQVATLTPPTVLGEIGLWRGQPAVATVVSKTATRLEVIVIDRQRFESLKHESGFRAATAAEVQRRLALNSALVGTLLEDTAARTHDPQLASIAQLFRFLTGDSHVPLDKVIGVPDHATPGECVEALREQVDAVMQTGSLPPELVRHLHNIVVTIG